MLGESHNAGVEAALNDFGAIKHASMLTPAFWKEVASNVKAQAIGHPLEALKQIRAGTLFNHDTGLYHHGLPKTLGSWASNLALPAAMTALFAHLSPPGSRGELVGGMAGRTVGSLLGGPLGGVVGQVGGGMLLAPVGQAVGKAYDGRGSNEQE